MAWTRPSDQGDNRAHQASGHTRAYTTGISRVLGLPCLQTHKGVGLTGSRMFKNDSLFNYSHIPYNNLGVCRNLLKRKVRRGDGGKLCAWGKQVLNTSILNKLTQMSTFRSHSVRCHVTFIIPLFILLLETGFYKPAFWITFSKF